MRFSYHKIKGEKEGKRKVKNIKIRKWFRIAFYALGFSGGACATSQIEIRAIRVRRTLFGVFRGDG